MNHMKEVAKMLGVELNEEFDVHFDNSNVYMKAQLTENGFKVNDTNMLALVPNSSIRVFEMILCGLATIKRKPWKPKYNEDYWAVTAIDGALTHNIWKNCWIDITYYKLGNCYRTEQEAETNSEKWISFYASDEVLEV